MTYPNRGTRKEVHQAMEYRVKEAHSANPSIRDLMKNSIQEALMDFGGIEFLDDPNDGDDDMTEQKPVSDPSFFWHQPAMQRFLNFKTANETLNEVRQLREKLEEKANEVKQNRHKMRLSNENESKSALPKSTVQLFEDKIRKDPKKLRDEIQQKKEARIWNSVDDVIKAHCSKMQFRKMYSKSRQVGDKMLIDQSLFCTILRENFKDAYERMVVMVTKKAKH